MTTIIEPNLKLHINFNMCYEETKQEVLEYARKAMVCDTCRYNTPMFRSDKTIIENRNGCDNSNAPEELYTNDSTKWGCTLWEPK